MSNISHLLQHCDKIILKFMILFEKWQMLLQVFNNCTLLCYLQVVWLEFLFWCKPIPQTIFCQFFVWTWNSCTLVSSSQVMHNIITCAILLNYNYYGGGINVDETNTSLLIFFVYVCFHLFFLQLPFHLLCAWFVYQIIVLLQKKLDVQHDIFLLSLALVLFA